MAIRNNTLPSGADAQAEQSERNEKTREALRLWAQRNKGLTDVFLDAFCLVDTSNQVVDFNVAFTELCGESYRKILKVGHFCELLRTELCPERCPARQIAEQKQALRLDELSGQTKAYPQLQVILGGVPIFSDDGEILGSLITVRNVSAESNLQKKYDESKKESVTDGLTRLFNKVYTESALVRMVRGSHREKHHAVSVVMCDIDHFKKVNDTYGHRAGDYVLATVAQMLKGESRETDVVGRFGGEEFIAILAASDRSGAQTFAERFRKRVEATEILFEGTRIPVTVSLGTSTLVGWDANGAADQAVKDLVGRADTALYFAKANGRNQTTQHEAISELSAKGGKAAAGSKASSK